MNSRRDFLKKVSLSAGAALVIGSTLDAYSNIIDTWNEKPLDVAGKSESKKLGIALVGLGMYSNVQLAPALQQTKYCKLTGIVTGTPSKADEWKKRYNISDKNIYNYQNFDNIKDNPDIDIVYVVLPNSMHAEYVIRAAKAGKHVICEKPMGVSVKECEEMIKACKDAGKMLSIGYRLHFEPYNMEMMRLGKELPFGKIKRLDTKNGFKVSQPSWRTDKKLAGW